MTTTAKYRVSGSHDDGWSVTSPSGYTTWTGAPSQPAAYNLASSMAGIDAMLAQINRPQLAVIAEPKQQREYYFGPARRRQ